MRHPAVPDGVSKGPGDVILAEHLGEALGPVSPIQGLIRSGIERVVMSATENQITAGLRLRPPVVQGPAACGPARAARTGADFLDAWRGGVVPGAARLGAWNPARRSGDLRHTGRSAESCCRQALTRFTVLRCAGPNRRARRQAPILNTIA